MLEKEIYKKVVRNTPLVSIDLCIVCSVMHALEKPEKVNLVLIEVQSGRS